MKRPDTVEDLLAAVRTMTETAAEGAEWLEDELRDVMLFGPPWKRVDGYPWQTQRWERI